ncbi:MAG: hypothetical protein J5806_14115 [Lentisphaeria bacterium]|nr:hypothetical protein [Lentisphaeria bacterium]
MTAIRKALPLGLMVLLLGGCFTDRPDPAPDDPELYAERIVRPRTERQLEKKQLVLVVLDGPEADREIGLARTALASQQIELTAVRVRSRSALSGLVRSGRADLMAGAFTADEIRQLHLVPVLPYAGPGRKSCCFAVRFGDRRLEELFDTAENNPSGKE